MREWYGWFHTRACPLWSDDANPQCPIMRVQRDNVTPPGLRFYPEALWGRPASPVWFMAINPGQSKLDSSPCEIAAERRACANTVDDPEPALDAHIARHNLASIFGHDENHPVFGDRVTSAAFGLLLGENRMVCVGDRTVDRGRRAEAVEKLTILNMAHCKCPDYLKRIGPSQRAQSPMWRNCGERNLEALLRCRPKLLVPFGNPPKTWLWWLRPDSRATDPWSVVGADADWSPFSSGVLGHTSGWSCRLLFLPHPSSRGGYDSARALRAYAAICGEVFGH